MFPMDVLHNIIRNEELAPQINAEKVLYFQSRLHPVLGEFRRDSVECVHDLRPEVNELRESGFSVSDREGSGYTLAIMPGTKFAELNHILFARALESLEEGGLFISVLPNNLGAGRFAKDLGKLAGNMDYLSKSKCRVFWCYKTADLNKELFEEWKGKESFKQIEGSELMAKPGCFSWKKIDNGSKLLVSSLPAELRGEGADLGAGYGFLSDYVIRHCKAEKIYLIESDRKALEAARHNLRDYKSVEIDYIWGDATKELPFKKLGWIVSNPPFHAGKDTDFDLGRSFIQRAAEALKKKGKLYLVANAFLPYEEVLKEKFSKVELNANRQGFKVYTATR